jgi:hypothetical protein
MKATEVVLLERDDALHALSTAVQRPSRARD